MAAYQYVYHMQGVSKTYPGGKNVLKTFTCPSYPV